MKHRMMWLAILVGALILQMTILPQVMLQTIRVDLLMIIVLAYGLLQGSKEGCLFGITVGLVADCFFGQPFGFQILLKAIIGFLAGRLHGMYLENQAGVPSLAFSGGYFAHEVMFFLGYRMFYPGPFFPSGKYWQMIGSSFFVSGAVFIGIYYLFRKFLQFEKNIGIIKD